MKNIWGINKDRMKRQLDEGVDTLETMKKHLESFEKDKESSVTVQLQIARASLSEKKQTAEDAMTTVMKITDDQREETTEAVAQWKARKFQKKLNKRAERAKDRAESMIMMALYYTSKAEVAILEAIVACQDANISTGSNKESDQH